MDDSLHYLIMANQMLVQKALLYKLKDTGLTIGQPKILDYITEVIKRRLRKHVSWRRDL